jgi:putative FmdB family regulatory protein
MPVYEYHCDKCDREVTLTLSIREHEKGEIK